MLEPLEDIQACFPVVVQYVNLHNTKQCGLPRRPHGDVGHDAASVRPTESGATASLLGGLDGFDLHGFILEFAGDRHLQSIQGFWHLIRV